MFSSRVVEQERQVGLKNLDLTSPFVSAPLTVEKGQCLLVLGHHRSREYAASCKTEDRELGFLKLMLKSA